MKRFSIKFVIEVLSAVVLALNCNFYKVGAMENNVLESELVEKSERFSYENVTNRSAAELPVGKNQGKHSVILQKACLDKDFLSGGFCLDDFKKLLSKMKTVLKNSLETVEKSSEKNRAVAVKLYSDLLVKLNKFDGKNLNLGHIFEINDMIEMLCNKQNNDEAIKNTFHQAENFSFVDEWRNSVSDWLSKIVEVLREGALTFVKGRFEESGIDFSKIKSQKIMMKCLTDLIKSFFDDILKICHDYVDKGGYDIYQQYIVGKLDENLERLWKIVKYKYEFEWKVGNLYDAKSNIYITEKNFDNPDLKNVRFFLKEEENGPNGHMMDNLRQCVNNICDFCLYNVIRPLENYISLETLNEKNKNNLEKAKNYVEKYKKIRNDLLNPRKIPDGFVGSASMANIRNLKDLLCQFDNDEFVRVLVRDFRKLNYADKSFKKAMKESIEILRQLLLENVVADKSFDYGVGVKTNKQFLEDDILNDQNLNKILNDESSNIIIDTQNSQFCDKEYVQGFDRQTEKICTLVVKLKEFCKDVNKKLNGSVNESVLKGKVNEQDIYSQSLKTLSGDDKGLKRLANFVQNRVKFSKKAADVVGVIAEKIRNAKLMLYIIFDKFTAACKKNKCNYMEAKEIADFRNQIEKSLELPEMECFSDYANVQQTDINIRDVYALKEMITKIINDSAIRYCNLSDFSEVDENKNLYNGFDYVSRALEMLKGATDDLQMLLVDMAVKSVKKHFERLSATESLQILSENETLFKNLLNTHFNDLFVRQAKITQPAVETYSASSDDSELNETFMKALTNKSAKINYLDFITSEIEKLKNKK